MPMPIVYPIDWNEKPKLLQSDILFLINEMGQTQENLNFQALELVNQDLLKLAASSSEAINSLINTPSPVTKSSKQRRSVVTSRKNSKDSPAIKVPMPSRERMPSVNITPPAATYYEALNK